MDHNKKDFNLIGQLRQKVCVWVWVGAGVTQED